MKAITVTGNKTVPIHDKEKTTAWCKKWFAYLQGHPLTGKQLQIKPLLNENGIVNYLAVKLENVIDEYDGTGKEEF